jgi:hypothetical protein
LQQAVTAAAEEEAAAAEVAAAAGVVAAAAGDMAARLRLAVAQLMAALAVAARVAAAEPVGAAAAVAVALAFGLEAAGAAPEETTPTAGNGIQPRASGSPSAINGKIRPFPRMAEEICPTLRRSSPRASALPPQQPWQLGEVRRQPPRPIVL